MRAPKLSPEPLRKDFVACLVRRYAPEFLAAQQLRSPVTVRAGGLVGVHYVDDGLPADPDYYRWEPRRKRRAEAQAFREILGSAEALDP